MPAKYLKLAGQITQIDNFFDGFIGLNFIKIDDGNQVVDLLIGGGLQRFPDLSFLEFTVTGHHHHPSFGAIHPFCQGHAFGFGNAHSQRSRIGFDSRDTDIRVPVGTVYATQILELLFGKQPQ